MAKTVLITGASAGVGRATAEQFAAAGWNVMALVRSADAGAALAAMPNVLVKVLERRDEAAMDDAVAATVNRFGGIDVLVNAEGFRIYGLLEAISVADMRRVFETNVLDVLVTTRSVVAQMRKLNRGGVVVNVGSIAGKMTYPLATLYNGTRFALEGISEALRFELAEIDVRVKLIEPGLLLDSGSPAPTEFYNDASLPEYRTVVDQFVDTMDDAKESGTEVGVCADVIFGAATDGSDRFRYLVGEDAVAYAASVATLDPEDYFGNMSSVFGLAGPVPLEDDASGDVEE